MNNLHRPGNKHINADALSRLPHPCKQCSHCNDDSEETVVKSIDDDPPIQALVRSIVTDLMIRRPDLNSVDSVRVRGIATSDLTTDVVTDSAGKSIAEMQSNDPSIGEFVKLLSQYTEQPSIDTLLLSSETTKTLWSQWFRYVVKDGVVYRLWFGKNGEPSRMQLLVPHEMRDDIIKMSHGGMCGGHMGIAKTCDQVQRRAFWPGWRMDTIRFCRRCPQCCTYHRGQLPRSGALQPIVAGAPFERMSIDLTGPHCRTARGSGLEFRRTRHRRNVRRPVRF